MPTRAKMTLWSLMEFTDGGIMNNFYTPGGQPDDPDHPIPAMDTSTAVFQIVLTCGELELIYPDPDFLANAIGLFCDVNINKWEKLWRTEYLEYNPLYNVEATEIEDHDLTYTRDDKGKYTGFNSATANLVNQADDKDTDKGKITRTRAGNIGVTSSQQLLQSERDVSDFSTYKVIAEDFKKEFCVLVY